MRNKHERKRKRKQKNKDKNKTKNKNNNKNKSKKNLNCFRYDVIEYFNIFFVVVIDTSRQSNSTSNKTL